MKGCELCGCAARMYCESDEASLCWDCDEKVHGANFLVAKHCRSLLCQVCQSLTPWKASGAKLGPTISICESCSRFYDKKGGERSEDREESLGGNDVESEYSVDGEEEDEEYDDDDSHDYEEGEDDEEEDEEDGENQVVPWSGPRVASSSVSEGEISSGFSGSGAGLKRMRGYNNTDLDSDDEIGCSSSHFEANCSTSCSRPSKQHRSSSLTSEAEAEDHHGQTESRSAAIIDSLKRLQRDMVAAHGQSSSAAAILGICRLSRDQSL